MLHKKKYIKHPLFNSTPPQLKEEELTILVEKLRKGQLSKEEKDLLFLSHVKLGIAIAGHKLSQYPFLDQTRINDLVSEAVLGIAEAIEEAPINLEHNNFTGYCVRYIKGHLRKCLANDSVIKGVSPEHKLKLFKLGKKARVIRIFPLETETKFKSKFEASERSDDFRLFGKKGRLRRKQKLESKIRLEEETDFWDLLQKAIKNPEEEAVIKLRSAGYTDQEIEELIGTSKSKVNYIRNRVQARFDQLRAEYE